MMRGGIWSLKSNDQYSLYKSDGHDFRINKSQMITALTIYSEVNIQSSPL